MGEAVIQSGNSISSGTVGNARGRLRLYNSTTGFSDLLATDGVSGINCFLPSTSGTLCLSSHNHDSTYGYGDGFGRSTMIALPRVSTADLNMDTTSTDESEWGLSNKAIYREYSPSGTTNLPSSYWYHVLTGVGSDRGYATQLALGMSVADMYYRPRISSTWRSWYKVFNAANSNGAKISSSAPSDTAMLWAY